MFDRNGNTFDLDLALEVIGEVTELQIHIPSRERYTFRVRTVMKLLQTEFNRLFRSVLPFLPFLSF